MASSPPEGTRRFTYEDERELLRFDRIDPDLEREFRSLYTTVPGFPPPSEQSCQALSFEVTIMMHPHGANNPHQTFVFEKHIPRGFYARIRKLKDEEGVEAARHFIERLRSAINNKYQHYDALGIAQRNGWRCVKCSKPCKYVTGKIMFFPDQRKMLLHCMTPQCGGEACRLALQREAELFTQEARAAVDARSAETNIDMSWFAGALTSENTARVCEACGTRERVGGEKHYRCTRCKVTFYCSKECQRKHWKTHKLGCKLDADVTAEKKNYHE